jgi:hypothetical protein
VVTVAGAVLLIALIAAGLAWTARLVHVGNLDALALSEKVGTPEPVSALDWPELHVRAVVAQPDEPSVVLLRVGWPARPQLAATLLVALDGGDQQSLVLLSQWCATRASVSPARRGDTELELRRRQSLERVHGVLIAEDTAPGAAASLRPGPFPGCRAGAVVEATAAPLPAQPRYRKEPAMAERALFIAPHPDDEVLGCGGTIAKLAAAGHSTRPRRAAGCGTVPRLPRRSPRIRGSGSSWSSRCCASRTWPAR